MKEDRMLRMRRAELAAMVASFVILAAMDYVQAQATDPKKPAPAAGQVQMEPKKPAQAIPSAKRFAERTGLVRSGELIGMNVRDAVGKDAGKIEDLLLDPNGEIAYAVISFGGLFGIGDKLFAVPWPSLMMDREHKAVLLAVNKETLERAPSFTKDKWPDRYDQTWSENVNKAWSDAAITAAVKSKLVADKASSLVKVNVETNQGVVELKGTVDSDRTKQRATDLARQVEGVRKVVNNLKTG
jgi:hypothetical protein